MRLDAFIHQLIFGAGLLNYTIESSFSCVCLELEWNPNFSNLQGKRKLVGEIGEFEKSGVKLQCLTEERERLQFGSSYREVREHEGSRNLDSIVLGSLFIFKSLMTNRELRVFLLLHLNQSDVFISHSIERHVLDLDLNIAEITQNGHFVVREALDSLAKANNSQLSYNSTYVYLIKFCWSSYSVICIPLFTAF